MTDTDLAALAKLFQSEGDDLTARAILEQLQAPESGAMHPDVLHELACIKATADGYCSFNGFDRAIPLYAQINTVFVQKLGATHARTMPSLADLAQCLFRNCLYAESLEAWTKLLCVLEAGCNSDKGLARRARRMIKNCQAALVLATSARNLGEHLQVMLRSDVPAPDDDGFIQDQRSMSATIELVNRLRFSS